MFLHKVEIAKIAILANNTISIYWPTGIKWVLSRVLEGSKNDFIGGAYLRRAQLKCFYTRWK